MKLTSAQDAIEQAIEGGYQGEATISQYGGLVTDVIFLDPLFWKALGKARGWSDTHDHNITVRKFPPPEFKEEIVSDDIVKQFQLHSHQWFETRMSGGDENKFWEYLP